MGKTRVAVLRIVLPTPIPDSEPARQEKVSEQIKKPRRRRRNAKAAEKSNGVSHGSQHHVPRQQNDRIKTPEENKTPELPKKSSSTVNDGNELNNPSLCAGTGLPVRTKSSFHDESTNVDTEKSKQIIHEVQLPNTQRVAETESLQPFSQHVLENFAKSAQKLYKEIPIHYPNGPETSYTEVEIRLIKIQPAKMDEPIVCEAFKVNIRDNVSFIALSYAWGDGGTTESIRVRDYDMKITKSLHQALQQLRKEDSTVTVWADAICINQYEEKNETNHEKRYQVKQMTKIYSAAEEVVAWLGPGTIETDRIMDLLTSDASRLHRAPSKDTRNDLKVFFTRDYWYRVWVVQEISCVNRTRRTCTLRCGQKSVTLQQLKQFLRNVRNIDWADSHTLLSPRALLSLSTQVESRSFIQVLMDASRLKATMPLDRIYGIRGISPKVYREKIEVDYDISFEQLSERVTNAIVNNDQSLDFLCVFHPFVREKEKDEDGVGKPPPPTWLRDIRHVIPGVSLEIYSASRGRKALQSIRNGILFARGLTVSTVGQGFRFKSLSTVNKSSTGLKEINDMFMTALASTYLEDTEYQRWNRFAAMMLGGRLQSMDVFSNEVNPRWKSAWEKRLAFEGGTLDSGKWYRDHDDYFRSTFCRLYDRCCFSTKDGKVGLGPWNMEAGDIVCVLYGCRLPVVLRREGTRYCKFIGPAYLDGAMGGESVKFDFKGEPFRIV